jgi:hypothetical protein
LRQLRIRMPRNPRQRTVRAFAGSAPTNIPFPL